MAQGAGLDALLLLLFAITIASASLIESRAQSKQLQRAVRHRQVVVVVEGVRERMTGTPSPDPLLLINFPDIDTQFKVHLLEDSNTLKLTLAQNDIDSKFRFLDWLVLGKWENRKVYTFDRVKVLIIPESEWEIFFIFSKIGFKVGNRKQ